jgi:quercetin dioxygenase-like cupin family protein
MPAVRSVEVAGHSFVIDETLAITQHQQRPGPPERLPGMTMGIINIDANAPHDGEIHPDGDEFLYVISGRLRVISESEPTAPVILGPGDACIVHRDEWHKVEMIEPAQLLHLTPGPNGDHRPLG